MCRGLSSIVEVLSDVAATALLQPELIPLINGVESTGFGLANGESFGKALGQGALAGGEAFAGSEILGAAANQFPETAGSLGIGTGGNSLTDLLGTTSGAGSIAGPGTIGGDISGMFTSSTPTVNAPGSVSSAPGNPGSTTPQGSVGTGASITGAPLPGAAASAAPSSVGGGGNIVDQFDSDLAGSPSSGGGNLNSFIGANTDPASLSPSAGGASLSSGADSAFKSSLSAPVADSIAASAGGSASTAPAAPSSGSSFLSHPSLSSFTKMLTSNPGAAISGLGLAGDVIKGNKPVSGEGALKTEAAQLGNQGQQLQDYLQSGTLPPGVQQSINQAAEARKAAIRSEYASQGGSGSSAMQQDLAAVDAWAQGQGASTAISLLNSGISESGLAANLYQDIAANALKKDDELGSAFGAFASSLGGGGQNINIKV